MNRLQEKAKGLKQGLYLHVPFCARQCDFCNFYQRPPSRAEVQEFIQGIADELDSEPPPATVDTMFWGGGTPGLLSPTDLRSLAESVLSRLAKPPAEWTIEMAPATVNQEKIKTLLELGVTRFSMGVQSFQEPLLERLGRVHSLSRIYKAYEILRQCGADNINLDLIFAIPGQSLQLWEQDLAEAIRLGPEHISTYCLTFEEDTALWLRLRKGEIEATAPADEADYYLQTWAQLEAADYAQYEVSNFARPGKACQHNLDTWAMQEWAGYGPSASGQQGQLRYTRAHSLEEWLAGLKAGKPAYADTVDLSPGILATDALIFGLRCNRGVNLDAWAKRFDMTGTALASQLNTFITSLTEDGLAKRNGSLIQLTREGRLLADRIGVEILELSS